MALGNTSVSSLMRSSESAATALEGLNVKAADQTWQDSAKTAQDYTDYQKALKPYVDKYAGTSTVKGQSNLITYQNKLTGAKVAFDGSTRAQERINMLQGGGSQSDMVSLLAKQYGEAVDPSERQSILQQYDQAVTTLDNQNQAAANKAASAAQSALQKSYTETSRTGTTLTSQIAASIASGKNQIDPKLLHGNATVFLNKDGTVAFDQTQATPGAKPVTITIPNQGGHMNIVDLYHLAGMVMLGKYDNESKASQDPGLSADEQSVHDATASSMVDQIQKSIYTNAQLATAEANGQPAIVRKYINGNAELVANPNVGADGEYILNPTTQSIQNSLAKQKSLGDTSGVDFNMNVDGVPTTYKLKNLGNAAVAEDPSAINNLSAKTFLFDSNKGQLVPLNDQHQQQFDQLRTLADPTEKANAEAQFMNKVQSDYMGRYAVQAPSADKVAMANGNKPGASAGDIVKGATAALKDAGGSIISKIDTAGQRFLNGGQAPTTDPLNRLGFGPVGSVLSGISHDISSFMENHAGGAIAAKQAAIAKEQAAAAQQYIHPAGYNVAPAPPVKPLAPAPAPVTTYNYKAPAPKQITYAPLPGQPGYQNPISTALNQPQGAQGAAPALKALAGF